MVTVSVLSPSWIRLVSTMIAVPALIAATFDIVRIFVVPSLTHPSPATRSNAGLSIVQKNSSPAGRE